ncbi:MAG: hypothetical protein RR436_05715 [Clostridia bacterium]
MRKVGVIPDGDLFRLQQQEILEKQKENEVDITDKPSKNSITDIINSILQKPFPSPLQTTYNKLSTSDCNEKTAISRSGDFLHKAKNSSLLSFDLGGYLSKFLENIGIEEIILMLLIFLLITENADIELILGLSFLLITGIL